MVQFFTSACPLSRMVEDMLDSCMDHLPVMVSYNQVCEVMPMVQDDQVSSLPWYFGLIFSSTDTQDSIYQLQTHNMTCAKFWTSLG